MENLRINESIQQNLITGCQWLKFLTIVECVMLAIILLVGICAFFAPIPGPIIGIVYFIMIAFFIYPIKKCFSFINNTREALRSDDQDSLDNAASDFANVLKYCGILTIVVIAIYILAFIAICLGGGLAALSSLH